MSSANYCSKDCQEQDWPEHKFECASMSSFQLDTADHLVRAAHRRHIPQDIDTLIEYRFVYAAKIGSVHELFDFWVDFIVGLEIPAKSLRNWRQARVLCQVIELVYAKSGRASRSQAFRWFQEHRWIIEPSLGIPQAVEEDEQATIARFSHWTGVPDATRPDMDEIKETWPAAKAFCFNLCEHIFCHIAVIPPTDLWVHFGFCVCRNNGEEKQLKDIYEHLFQLYTFEEFWLAYEDRTLWFLVDSSLPVHGWHRRTELLGILQAPPFCGCSQIVWLLKGIVLFDSDTFIVHEKHHPLTVMYGFSNARSVADVKELKRLYRRLLLDANVCPLQLHEVAIADEIYSFANSTLGFGSAEKALFRWLLRAEIVEYGP